MGIKEFSLPFQSLKDLEELDNLVDSIKSTHVKNIYYRGQREGWSLLPGIAQPQNIPKSPKDEFMIFEAFCRESEKILKTRPNNKLDWLAIAQHHGLPTRLLDWTTNPYVGLWFAVRIPAENKTRPGVLWVFTPEAKDVFSKDISARLPFSGSRTKVFFPTTHYLDERIKAQSGAFTVHKFIEKENRFVPLEINKQQKTKLLRIIIDTSDFSRLRKQLRDININDSILFPDLDGLSRDIKTRYIRLIDEQQNE